jgi:hypothetical protein
MEESLQKKRLKLLIPNLPGSRKLAVQMDIERSEALLRDVLQETEKIEEELRRRGMMIPKQGADIATSGFWMRSASVSPTFGSPGAGCGLAEAGCKTEGN